MSRRIVAVATAVVLALVGTLAVLVYVRNADRRALEGQQAVSAYVAQKIIPAGTTVRAAIDERLMAQELIAAKAVPDEALSEVTPDMETLVAASDIAEGELVLSSRFAAEQQVDGALRIPEGKMAVSVELADPARVGQFLTAGSEIAVFDTFNVQEADKADTTPAGDQIQNRHEFTRATRVLLPRVKVLAVGATTTKTVTTSEEEDQGAQSTQTQVQASLVTVAVDQQEAEALVHGIQTGTLYFALLNESSKTEFGPGVTDRKLFARK